MINGPTGVVTIADFHLVIISQSFSGINQLMTKMLPHLLHSELFIVFFLIFLNFLQEVAHWGGEENRTLQ